MDARQIVFDRLGRVAVESLPGPQAPPGPDEALIAPAFLGICGTDLHVLHGKHPWVRPPLVTGHEAAGTVLGVGACVRAIAAGDRVVLNPLVSCGACRPCRRGAFNHCENAKVIGFRLPGAGRSRLAVPAAQLHRVPAALDLDLACLAEPLAVGVHAASLFDDLEDVLVVGGGTIGLCVLLALRARGAGRVTVVEPAAGKRALARHLGAAATLTPDEAPGGPYTATFDCVAAQSTIDRACAATLTGGAVVIVGVPSGPRSFPLPRMQRFEIGVLGSGMYLGRDIEAALALLAAGAIDARALISGVLPLEEAPAAYARAERTDSVKILIRMD